MSITSIRKTKMPYKGGPGAIGVRFDPVDGQLKIHTGTGEVFVVVSAAAIPTVDPEDGESIWSDEGVLKVASIGG